MLTGNNDVELKKKKTHLDSSGTECVYHVVLWTIRDIENANKQKHTCV